VLIVSLKHTHRGDPPPLDVYPTTPLLMGKVLNALMLDHTDYDLDRLRRFNALLEVGEKTFGEDFIPKMNETIAKLRGQPYRRVQDLVIRPSRDISEIASKHARASRMADVSKLSLPSKLLHRIAQSQLINEADLASYLLFDGAYAEDLIQLGMEDALARREELLRFFGEP
jgi:NTE family protein